jgi:hypothetical protein
MCKFSRLSISKNTLEKILPRLVIKIPRTCTQSGCTEVGLIMFKNKYICKNHSEKEHKKIVFKRLNIINNKSDEELEKNLHNLIKEIHIQETLTHKTSIGKENTLIYKFLKHILYKRGCLRTDCELCSTFNSLKMRLTNLMKEDKTRQINDRLKNISIENAKP